MKMDMELDFDPGFEDYFQNVQENIINELRNYQWKHEHTNLYMSLLLQISHNGYDKLVRLDKKRSGCFLRTLCRVFYYTDIEPSKVFKKKKKFH